MSNRSQTVWARYGVAVLSIVVAAALRKLITPLVGDAYPYATIFLAVVFSAWYGGFGPALAAALAGFAAAAMFLAPQQRSPAAGVWPLGLLLYLATSLSIALLGGAMATARRRLAQQVEATERQREQLRATLASIGDAVVVTDEHGRVTSLNAVAEALTGWTAGDAAGRPLEEVFHIINEHTRSEVESPVERALREGTVVGLANHTLLIAKDGSERPIDDSAAPIRDSKGRVLGVVLVFRDITERRAAEESLGRLAAIVQSSDDGIVSKSLGGIITTWNAGAERIYGYTADEIIGRPFSILVPPDRAGEVELIIGRLARGERIDHFETVRRRKDGRLINVSVSYSPVHGRGGRLTGAAVITRDITEQKQAERTAHFLAEASQTLAGVVDLKATLERVARLAVPLLADWCLVDLLDVDGVLRRMAIAHADPSQEQLARLVFQRWPFSPGGEEGPRHVLLTGEAHLIGELKDEALTRAAIEPALRESIRALGLQSYIGVPLLARSKVLGVLTFLTADSGRRYRGEDLAAIEDFAQRAAAAIDNAQLYQALRDADRRKDEFLAVLAHELRNPLAPIASALAIMKLAGGDVAAIAEAREVADRQLAQLTRLVDDLLDVSRIMQGKIELRKQPVEMAAVVERAVESVRPLIDAEGHELTVTLPPQPLWFDADAVRMSQVLANLLNNAAKYTPPGGRIGLSVERDGELAVIRVRDTGIGIAAEALPRLFELFVQAAPAVGRSRGGLGIGLTLVKKLVEMHGGTIEAASEGPGQGSEFTLRIPAAPEPRSAAEAPPAPSQTAPPAAPRRVLVVDDNVDAAKSLAILLRLQGHNVRLAHSGEEALAAAADDAPQVVLLDIGMPGMSGYEVAHRLRERFRPEELTLVALTGWGQEQDRRHSREAGFDHHLVKPVELATLQAVLNHRDSPQA